jgi:hypothetical protein
MPEVAGPKAGVVCYARQHSRAEFFIIVECKHIIGPAWPRQRAVRTSVALDRPPDPSECSRHPARRRDPGPVQTCQLIAASFALAVILTTRY